VVARSCAFSLPTINEKDGENELQFYLALAADNPGGMASTVTVLRPRHVVVPALRLFYNFVSPGGVPV
jgi:hypothetical protein